MPLGRRLLRTGGGLHVLTGSHLDEHRPANEFCRAGWFFGRPRHLL